MTYTQSDLSNPYHGDFVFAVTQGNINAAMLNYLSNLPLPEVICVWVMSESQPHHPEQIDFKELLRRANNTDPFSVPGDADPTTNQGVKNLVGARFIGGFKARMGLPPGLDLSKANIVTLGADVTSVKFNLMCSEFVVAQYTPGDIYNNPSWMNIKQGTGTPWIFETRVNLQLVKFEGDDATLPAAVQDRIQALQLQPDSFSIQRLLFDLDNAALESVPTVPAIPITSALYRFLQTYFMGAYWNQMKANKQPVLAHAIMANPGSSSLALTDLRFQISPYINGTRPPQNPQDLYTLCYVGTTDNHQLPIALPPFTWNWIDDGQQTEWSGAVAVNRKSFGAWLTSALMPYVKTQCVAYYPVAQSDGFYLYAGCTYSSGQTPSTPAPPGNSLAYFTYNKDFNSQVTSLQVYLKEDLAIEVTQKSDTQISITQKIVVYLYFYVRGLHTNGNIVNSEVTSVYDMSVDDQGAVKFTFNAGESKSENTPDNVDFSGFVNGMEDDPNSKVIDPMKASISSAINSLGSPTLGAASFIVPGHADVSYSGVKFSEGGDLVFHMNYGASR